MVHSFFSLNLQHTAFCFWHAFLVVYFYSFLTRGNARRKQRAESQKTFTLTWKQSQSSENRIRAFQVSNAALRETLVGLCKAAAEVTGKLQPEVICLLLCRIPHAFLRLVQYKHIIYVDYGICSLHQITNHCL